MPAAANWAWDVTATATGWTKSFGAMFGMSEKTGKVQKKISKHASQEE